MADFKKGMLKRILIFAVVITFLFCADGIRVLYLQVVKHDDLAAKAESQQLSDTEVKAMLCRLPYGIFLSTRQILIPRPSASWL